MTRISTPSGPRSARLTCSGAWPRWASSARRDEEAALRQPIKLKPYRPEWIKECGYFNEQVRSQLEDRFGKESVYNMGLKVYTTADVQLAQGGPGRHRMRASTA